MPSPSPVFLNPASPAGFSFSPSPLPLSSLLVRPLHRGNPACPLPKHPAADSSPTSQFSGILPLLEANTATNMRDTTFVSVSGAPFRINSTSDFGVWEQPPADFMGTHATDGTKWVVSPEGGSMTLTMDPYMPARRWA